MLQKLFRREPERSLADRLRGHVVTLAEEIGERNVFRPRALASAVRYIRDAWRGDGFSVRSSTYVVEGVKCENLEVEVRGKSPEIVLFGAHYDSVRGCPGANDNGTGVAVLLETARLVRGLKPERTIRFVAFANEEPPWFQTPDMGSWVYAAAARKRGDRIVGMVSLETLGYYSDLPGTQHYPPGLELLFPDRGNFVAVVGDLKSQSLVSQVTDAFIAARRIPVESLATFPGTPGVDWSDHASFWQHGYPGVMLTDTAPYRYPHYHEATDRVEHVQFDKLADVTLSVAETARRLARA